MIVNPDEFQAIVLDKCKSNTLKVLNSKRN